MSEVNGADLGAHRQPPGEAAVKFLDGTTGDGLAPGLLDDRARAQLERSLEEWRARLIDLTRRNRLLNFRPTPTSSVKVIAPEATRLLGQLVAGKKLEVAGREAEPEDESPDSVRDAALADGDPAVVTKALKSLRSRGNAQFLDTGLHVLYLAFGALNWTDVDGERNLSPLLLVPVRLESEPSSPRVRVGIADEEDAAVNPALSLKLQDFGVTLPSLEDSTLDGAGLDRFLRATGLAVAGQAGWKVAGDVYLSYFQFTKESMYRDLLDNEAVILENLAVAALANAGTGHAPDLRFPELLTELDPEVIDSTRPPEKHPVVQDADAFQRRAIAAAVAGKSFVVQGPPGTGKSQTITNMIAALLHEGKTVLFVSEKAAALEVVRNQLQAVGLAGYVLELHSHKAKRAEVARTLADSLTRRPDPPAGITPIERETAAAKRKQLNAYAAAMNEVRQPLQLSVIHIAGRIAQLHPVAAAQPLKELGRELNPESLANFLDAARHLSRNWAPSIEGERYLWYQVAEEGPLAAVLFEARAALEGLREATKVNERVGSVFLLDRPSDATVLNSLIGLWGSRPFDPPRNWLTSRSLVPIRASVEQLRGDLQGCASSARAVWDRTGLAWDAVPPRTPIVRAQGEVPAGIATLPVGNLTVEQSRVVRDYLRLFASVTAQIESAAGHAAAHLGLPAPEDDQQVAALDEVLRAAVSRDRPDRAWLLEPAAAEAAQEAVSQLYAAHANVAAARAEASSLFIGNALELDLAGLQSRFQTLHHGLKKLGGAYRDDKALLMSATQPGVKPKDAIANIDSALRWQAAERHLQEVQARRGGRAGRRYIGADTEWDALAAAAANAVTIASYGPEGTVDLRTAANLINADTPVDPRLPELIRSLNGLRQHWQEQASHPPARPAPALVDLTFAQIKAWAHHQLPLLEAWVSDTENLNVATGRQWTLSDTSEVMTLRETAERHHAELESHAPVYVENLGSLYAGLNSDTGAITSALQWVSDLRGKANGEDSALTDDQVDALAEAAVTDIGDSINRWGSAASQLAEAFLPERRPELLHELDHYRDGVDFLDQLIDDPEGQQIWFENRSAVATLTQHGLSRTVEFCVTNGIPAAEVPAVIEKAILAGWLEHVLETTPELRPFSATDRDTLVREYRQLDKRLVDTAITDILSACGTRRPRASSDQTRAIEAEGAKKTRHMPVRSLLDRAADAALALKPCFMMSPMSVSQYLPPGIKFDVVIFDEASQVRPEDAINSIYRGRALIVVGDDKQMPPTSFWDKATGSDDDTWVEGDSNATDFESILTLAGGSAAFERLMLQIHYRSRHENLIAFSNHSFYEGKLHTFPSAKQTSDHLGVAYYHVNGVYQRGSTKDNPREAERVVQRVIHHYDARPTATLGVVAFSESQATAIQLALEEALKVRPDLRDRLDSNDRLRGFFIKNLETVQGDERDVIIFSVGYGPDEAGKITNNFGPLNRDGGWRRLNVAITRARNRVEVVASLRATDITGTNNESVRHFRNYLDYAERGPAALEPAETSDQRDPESPFEESVISTINSWGYTVQPQVGTAGYRIDIGVLHPDKPDTLILGVECDGYAYHSSKTARDRDRIRHSILQGLGWNLQHIWGTAWYRQRANEERRLKDAIEAALKESENHIPLVSTPDPARTQPTLIEDTIPDTPEWAHPYNLTLLSPIGRWPSADPADPAIRGQLAKQITQIAMIEGPVHTDLVDERLKEVWGVKRIGARIRDNIDAAKRQANVRIEGPFIDVLARLTPVSVRVPTAEPRTRRTIEQVHEAELREAITAYVRDSRGIGRDQLFTQLARLYGWNRLGGNIQWSLEQALDRLVGRGLVIFSDDTLTLKVPNAPSGGQI